MGELGEPMGIAELSDRAGVTPRTIRYYTSIGLLPPAGGPGTRQTYGHQHYVRLLLIQRLKEEYLPLDEIKRRLDGLPLADIERLLSTAPPSRSGQDTRGYVESLWREGRSRTRTAPEPPPASGPPESRSNVLESRRFGLQDNDVPTTLREQVAARAQDSADLELENPSSGDAWHRATLDRGVELHYQLSGDARRDGAIEYIIQFAMRTLRRAAKPGRPVRPDRDSRRDDDNRGDAVTRIHLIDRHGRFMRLADDEYESGYWAVSWRTAQRLVGGAVYFHKRQREPSYFGGRILGFRKSDSPKYPGRMVFRFRSGPEFEGVSAGERGWKQERKTVMENDL